MFKSFVFLFWIVFTAMLLGVLIWLYGENLVFQEFVDSIWGDFIRFFKEKIHI